MGLWVGDELFASRWFEVATYAKPVYEIDVTPDREALFAGETVNFRVRATFFEGTPVPDMQLNYRIGGEAGSVTTDANGEAVISYTPPKRAGELGMGESWLTLYVTGGEPETGEVTAERTIRLFHRDVMAAGRDGGGRRPGHGDRPDQPGGAGPAPGRHGDRRHGPCGGGATGDVHPLRAELDPH